MSVSRLFALRRRSLSHFAFQVYYDVETQKATYRQDVKKEAYEAAKHLTGAVGGH